MRKGRPKLYFQVGNGDCPIFEESSRIRIIYPDGSCEWQLGFSDPCMSFYPCWASRKVFNYKDPRPWNTWALGICKSQEVAIKRMQEFDRKWGFPPADYLGEL